MSLGYPGPYGLIFLHRFVFNRSMTSLAAIQAPDHGTTGP